eukprot:357611-Chlamydomonas_euryale.AAC.3
MNGLFQIPNALRCGAWAGIGQLRSGRGRPAKLSGRREFDARLVRRGGEAAAPRSGPWAAAPCPQAVPEQLTPPPRIGGVLA